MIVITSSERNTHRLIPGDRVKLSIDNDTSDARFCKTFYEFEVMEDTNITYHYTFRFALEDGTCIMPFVYMIAGNATNMPKEILNAPKYEDLPESIRERFLQTYKEWIDAHDQRVPLRLDAPCEPLRPQHVVYVPRD